MGQKTHPYGFRLGITKTWRSRWFAKADYSRLLQEDQKLKESLVKRLKAAGLSSIEVDRPGNKLRITIRTSRPGIVIGRKGAEIEKLKADLAKSTKRDVFIDIQEVLKPELDAQLVSESIAMQLEKRVAFRRAMRKAVDSALRFGCKGIKVRVSGRLNGAEIARSEWYLQGRLPLHTLRADIDYGFTEAHTTYGVIGIKCWIYKGEVLEGGRKMTGDTGDARPRRRERRPREGAPREGGREGGYREGGRDGGFRGPRDAGRQAAPTTVSAEAPATETAPILPPLVSPAQSGIVQPDPAAAAPAVAATPVVESAPVTEAPVTEASVPEVTAPEAVAEAPKPEEGSAQQ